MDHTSASGSSDHLVFKGRTALRQARASPRELVFEAKIDDTTSPAPVPKPIPSNIILKDATNAVNTAVKDDVQNIKERNPLTNEAKPSTRDLSAKHRRIQRLSVNSQQIGDGHDDYADSETVQRTRMVKATLNKLTPESVDRVSDKLLEIISQSKQESDGRTLQLVAARIIEMATGEAQLAPVYAKLCSKLVSNVSNEIRDEKCKDYSGNYVTGPNLFRKYLLNPCQEEFEIGEISHIHQRKASESKHASIPFDEYFEIAITKRRYIGLMRFVGELSRVGMLTERIMHECIKKLLDHDFTAEAVDIEGHVLCSERLVNGSMIPTRAKVLVAWMHTSNVSTR